MDEKRFDDNVYTCYVGDDIFEYSIENKYDGNSEISIVGYSGESVHVNVPCEIIHNGVKLPVTKLQKKVFLAKNYLAEIVIPNSVSYIGDWAMAQCKSLKTVIIHPVKVDGEINLLFGRGVFDDCNSLMDICIGTGEKNTMSALMAALPIKLKSYNLLNSINIDNSSFLEKWDMCLLNLLSKDDYDEENYMSWGEEDSLQNKLDLRSESIINKISLCMLRLMKNEELLLSTRTVITEYILRYNIGCESEETWKYITQNHGDDVEYFKLLADIGGVTEANIYKMLESLAEEFTEVKAYLIRYHRDNMKQADAFSRFTL